MRGLPLITETRMITVVDLHDRLNIEGGKAIEIAIGRVIARLVIVRVAAAAAVLVEAGRGLVAKAKKS
jgi:hypothetical protein